MMAALGHMGHDTKLALDAFSMTIVGASFVSLLPPIATLFTIIWMAIRVWETETIQKWVKRPKKRAPRRGPRVRPSRGKRSGKPTYSGRKGKKQNRKAPKKDNDTIPRTSEG